MPCGPRALRYGKTADNVIALDGDHWLGRADHPRSTAEPRSLTRADRPEVSSYKESRQPSAPSSGVSAARCRATAWSTCCRRTALDVARFLAGSEGTLAVITGATVRLVKDAPYKIMIALGYPTMADAADAAPLIVDHRPTACEGLTAGLSTSCAASEATRPYHHCRAGTAGCSSNSSVTTPCSCACAPTRWWCGAGALDGFVVTDPAEATALWKIREDGAGLASISLARQAYPGWEDARCRPSTSAHTFATSTGYLMIMDWTDCRMATSGRLRATYGSTSR